MLPSISAQASGGTADNCTLSPKITAPGPSSPLPHARIQALLGRQAAHEIESCCTILAGAKCQRAQGAGRDVQPACRVQGLRLTSAGASPALAATHQTIADGAAVPAAEFDHVGRPAYLATPAADRIESTFIIEPGCVKLAAACAFGWNAPLRSPITMVWLPGP